MSRESLRELTENTRQGSSLLGLSNAAEEIGFRTMATKTNIESLIKSPLPCILHWNKMHFTVLYKIKGNTYYTSDPAHGLLKFNKENFLRSWIGRDAHNETNEGIALFLEPTPRFYESDFTEKDPKLSFNFISKYLFKYQKFLWQLVIGLICSSLLQLIFPFLTQSIVDVGIKNQDIHFVYLILFAQLALFLGKTSIEVIRSWILLHISARINISLVSDFFIKLMNLPISYFDTKMSGDIMQRIKDHERIEKVLTSSSLNGLFSMINLLVFSLVLAYYDLNIFLIFIGFSFFYFLWILLFLKKREEIDYKHFSQLSQEHSNVIELIDGMQEIKLHNAEKQKRWGWESIQTELFNLSLKGLSLEQFQNVGSGFINELKNILISFLAAKLVIDGEITLGMMLAISYIVGQLNSPILQLLEFIREVQDAKISMSRLSEIHSKKDEEHYTDQKIRHVVDNQPFDIKNVSFRYLGSSQFALKNIHLSIPANKVTAIVGTSGSGKTTLMKILLKFYSPSDGSIHFGNSDLANISQKIWRDQCGVVMQEGYIFSDTIARNIAFGEDHIDKEKLAHAIDVANIKEYIESLPISYNTKIGMDGIGLSTGQKQRILIARAVYKNPDILFFDEATSALDANNEKVIMEKLNEFFFNKTVMVIAHRLSTVKNADQIVVLEKGEIIEVGDHKALVKRKGAYYHLIKNQLELGS